MLPLSTTLPIEAQKILIEAAKERDQINSRSLITRLDSAIYKVRKEFPSYFKEDPLYPQRPNITTHIIGY